MKFKDITGQVFGRLTAVSFSKRQAGGKVRTFWTCQCECGGTCEVVLDTLVSGTTTSCGCFRREDAVRRATTHDRTRTPEHITWMHMNARCNHPENPKFKYWAGRGIKVCDRWKDSFENFLEDMGEKPGVEYSIDRIDNDGDYTPENCRWATRKEQARNSDILTILEFNGESKCISDWAEVVGIRAGLISSRLYYGWTVEEALITPLNKRRNKKTELAESQERPAKP